MTGLILALVAAPGLVFEALYRRLDSERRDSAFIEIQRILLTGVGSALVAVGVVWAVLGASGGRPLDVGRWLEEGTVYSAPRVTPVVLTGVAVLLVACAVGAGLAYVCKEMEVGRGARSHVRPALWSAILAAGTGGNAIVKRSDGSILVGRVTDVDDASRGGLSHIALIGPFAMHAANGEELVGAEEWQRVVLRLDGIDEIWLPGRGEAA